MSITEVPDRDPYRQVDPTQPTMNLHPGAPANEETLPGDVTDSPASKPVVRLGQSARKPGSTIGLYIVEKVLGAGGMGVVYEAQDPHLERRVAIKVLAAAASKSKQLGKRLLREAQSMARLSHPNVVTVFEIGTSEGEIFISMELVRGSTLKRWLEESRAQVDVLRVMIDAGRGLQAAHKAQIIHRDFKPDNVLIDQDGRARVSDFGLARATEDRDLSSDTPVTPLTPVRRSDNQKLDRENVDLTRTGELMGTPAYMAPEQHMHLSVDARCDQFSFGVACFEALTGYHPFSRPSDNLALLLARVSEGEMIRPPPDARKLSRSLRGVLLRAMATDREKRYPSMTELLADLERERDREAKARGRRRQLAAGAAVVLAGSAATTLLVIKRSDDKAAALCASRRDEMTAVWTPETKQKIRHAFESSGAPNASSVDSVIRSVDQYAQAWTDMSVSSCEATHVRHEQSESLLELRSACLAERKRMLTSFINAASNADAGLVKHSDKAVRALLDLGECGNARGLASRLPEPTDPTTRRQLDEIRDLLSRANVHIFAWQREHATPLVAAAAKAASAVDYPPIMGELYLTQGRLAALLADLPAARDYLMRASASAETGHDDLLRASSLVELVWLGFLLKDFRQGELFFELANATLERVGGDRALQASLLRNAGLLAFAQGKVELALERQRASLDIRETLFGESSDEVAEVLVDSAGSLREQGKLGEAMEQLERVVDIVKNRHGEYRTVYADAMNEMANIYMAQGLLVDARDAYQKSLKIFLAVLGNSHPMTAVAYANLGTVAALEESWDQAIVDFGKALEIEQKAYGPDHLELTSTLMNLGGAYETLARTEAARAHYARAAEIRERQLGRLDPLVAEPLVALGELALEQRQPKEAVAYFERALAAAEAPAGQPDQRAEVCFAMARALGASRQDRDRARGLAERAVREYTAAELPDEADVVRNWLSKN